MGFNFQEQSNYFRRHWILILTVTVACYAKIFSLVKKEWHRDLTEAGCTERQSLTENAHQKERIKRRERKLIRCVAIRLVGLLIVCWAPRFVLVNIALLHGESLVNPGAITSTASWLCFLHPLVNPITYSLCTRKFRRALWKIICKCNSAPPRCTIA